MNSNTGISVVTNSIVWVKIELKCTVFAMCNVIKHKGSIKTWKTQTERKCNNNGGRGYGVN